MKTILVPVDLSGATVKVCDAAAKLAREVGGRLIILHAVPRLPLILGDYYAFEPGHLSSTLKASRKAAVHKLDSLQRWFHRRCPQTKVAMHDGAPSTVILRTAKAVRADYVVIGSHGHTAAYDLLVGSVTHTVLRKAPCPVVVVPIAKTPRKSRAADRYATVDVLMPL
ncbi:MAG TPA: universal stress protein [Candidatus Didemnitutus sp.]|nr:universal stress protein [Candidatus Didemnitutus sp.]